MVSSLQRKTDESETNYEETGKQSEKQEVPVIDNDAIIKLEAENQQLKVGFLDIDSETQFLFNFFSLDNLYISLSTHHLLGVGQFIGGENRCLRPKTRRNKLKHHRAVEGECFI